MGRRVNDFTKAVWGLAEKERKGLRESLEMNGFAKEYIEGLLCFKKDWGPLRLRPGLVPNWDPEPEIEPEEMGWDSDDSEWEYPRRARGIPVDTTPPTVPEEVGVGEPEEGEGDGTPLSPGPEQKAEMPDGEEAGPEGNVAKRPRGNEDMGGHNTSPLPNPGVPEILPEEHMLYQEDTEKYGSLARSTWEGVRTYRHAIQEAGPTGIVATAGLSVVGLQELVSRITREINRLRVMEIHYPGYRPEEAVGKARAEVWSIYLGAWRDVTMVVEKVKGARWRFPEERVEDMDLGAFRRAVECIPMRPEERKQTQEYIDDLDGVSEAYREARPGPGMLSTDRGLMDFKPGEDWPATARPPRFHAFKGTAPEHMQLRRRILSGLECIDTAMDAATFRDPIPEKMKDSTVSLEILVSAIERGITGRGSWLGPMDDGAVQQNKKGKKTVKHGLCWGYSNAGCFRKNCQYLHQLDSGDDTYGICDQFGKQGGLEEIWGFYRPCLVRVREYVATAVEVPWKFSMKSVAAEDLELRVTQLHCHAPVVEWTRYCEWEKEDLWKCHKDKRHKDRYVERYPFSRSQRVERDGGEREGK